MYSPDSRVGSSAKLILHIAIAMQIALPSVSLSETADLSKEDGESINSYLSSGNFADAIDLLLPYAEAGNHETQGLLGLCYWYVNDTPSALKWWDRASDEDRSSSEAAEIVRAILARIGDPNPVSKSELIARLTERATKGDGEAQFLLHRAWKMFLVDSVDRDFAKSESRRWLDAAVKTDNVNALLEKARLLASSRDAESGEERRGFLHRAADLGSPRAMMLLAMDYEPYSDNSTPKPHGSYRQAMKWYRAAHASSGPGERPQVASFLARFLMSQRNPYADLEGAVPFLEESASAGDYWDQMALAEIYEDGDVAPRDHERALHWYHQAVQASTPEYLFDDFAQAQYKIARAHELGTGVPQDVGRAAEVYREVVNHPRAAEQDRPWQVRFLRKAIYRLGVISEANAEVGAGERPALQLYAKAAELGSVPAQVRYEYLTAASSSYPLARLKKIQRGLGRLGYRVGAADGVFGQRTFMAIRAYQYAQSLKVDGLPSDSVLSSIQKARSNQRVPRNDQLFSCIDEMSIECLESALAQGANPNARKYAFDPLALLVNATSSVLDDEDSRELRLQMARVLILYGTHVSQESYAFFSSISDGDLEFMKLLLENGADASRRRSGKSPLALAAYYRQPEIASLLENYGAIPLSELANAQERFVGAMGHAFGASGIAIAEQALANGARIDGAASDGSTALLEAVGMPVYTRGQLKRIAYLLEKGANVNQEGESGFQGVAGIPLHVFVVMTSRALKAAAPENERDEISRDFAVATLRLLLKAGAKVASRGENGKTPLHLAAEHGNYIAAALLIRHGARPAQRDSMGRLPVDYAESSEMIALLEGRDDAPQIAGVTSVSLASGSGVLISSDGYVLTNAHVVSRCGRVTVSMQGGEPLIAEVVATDSPNDLALLRHEMRDHQPTFFEQAIGIWDEYWTGPALPGLRDQPVRVGEKVVVGGYPYGDRVSDSLKITTGVVSALKGLGDDSSQFQLDAAVQPGSSGGPVYDARGNWLGIVVAGLDKIQLAIATGSVPENVNFAIKASTARVFLQSVGYESSASAWDSERSPEEVAEIAARQAVRVECVP